MKSREPMMTWLPSTDQIMTAPERAILASLDANLELAIRVLKAEHVDLRSREPVDPEYEPFTAALLPIAQAAITCAEHLHRLIGDYRTQVDILLADARRDDREPTGDELDPEIPF